MPAQVLEALETNYPASNVTVNLTFTTPVLATDLIVVVAMWKVGTGAGYSLTGMGATWTNVASRGSIFYDNINFHFGTNPSSQTLSYNQGRAGRLFALLVRGVASPQVDVMSPVSTVQTTGTSVAANTITYSDIVNGRDGQLIITAASTGSTAGVESWPAAQTPSGWSVIGSTDNFYNLAYHIPTSSTSTNYQTGISTSVSTAINMTSLVIGRLPDELNVREQYIESVTNQTDPPLKYTAAYTEALSHQTSPPLKYTSHYIEIMTIHPVSVGFIGWGHPL